MTKHQTPNTGCKCSPDANCANWNPEEEVNRLIKSIENETDLKKIAEAAHKCLHLMSLSDACQYMMRHKYPITVENIMKFKNIADQSYLIRLEIMKNLILE